jgi:hypothetical protein
MIGMPFSSATLYERLAPSAVSKMTLTWLQSQWQRA